MSGAELLERAITYAFGAIDTITPDLLTRATPCSAWDLRALLDHLNDSLAALSEAVEAGLVAAPASPDPAAAAAADPAGTFRRSARHLLGALTTRYGCGERPVDVGDHALAVDLVAMTGAVEIAVHGWDIYRARGHTTPIPTDLALDMLAVCPLLVTDQDRSDRRFAARVPVRTGEPSDWLVAYLGRDPATSSPA